MKTKEERYIVELNEDERSFLQEMIRKGGKSVSVPLLFDRRRVIGCLMFIIRVQSFLCSSCALRRGGVFASISKCQ